MTMGIAATGTNAGTAVLQSLTAAEKIASGAIGGFVAAAAIKDDRVIRVETQTGGVSGLHAASVLGEFKQATIAGLISSGPNRPAPLASFIAALPGIGLVTGHRMPNAIGNGGLPMNEEVLQLLAAGTAPDQAVNRVIDANPTADCGLIALSMDGQGQLANTASVTRPDAGMATGRRQDAAVWVLHNAMQPSETLASLMVELALDIMAPRLRRTGSIHFNNGCTVEVGDCPTIQIDERDRVTKIIARCTVTADSDYPLDIGYQTAVILNGKPHAKLLYEPLLLANGKKLISADGEFNLDVVIGQPALLS